MKLRLVPEAEAEIEGARKYLNQQSLELGFRFLKDLERTLQEVREHPLRYPVLETRSGAPHFRRNILRIFRYVIIFKVLSDEIVILAVAHTSRAPEYWLHRDS